MTVDFSVTVTAGSRSCFSSIISSDFSASALKGFGMLFKISLGLSCLMVSEEEGEGGSSSGWEEFAGNWKLC